MNQKSAGEVPTDKRYCGNCRKHVCIDVGGEWRKTNAGKRWICQKCLDNISKREKS